MSQLASIATLAGTGASLYGGLATAQANRGYQVAQAQESADSQAAREAALGIQQQAADTQRQLALARTIAGTRASLAAGGVAPDDGSAAAIAAGAAQDSATQQASSDALYNAHLAGFQPTLLTPDTTFNSFVRAGQGLGGIVSSLLG